MLLTSGLGEIEFLSGSFFGRSNIQLLCMAIGNTTSIDVKVTNSMTLQLTQMKP